MGNSQIEKEKKPEPKATFSLRQLLLTSVLANKTEKQTSTASSKDKMQITQPPGKLTKFQSFTLHNMKTIEAVSAMEEENITGTGNKNVSLKCSKCEQSFRTWSQAARHIIQESGSFSKHLSKSLDQCLVIYSTTSQHQVKQPNLTNTTISTTIDQAHTTSLTSVLRCRKCKFYLPTNSDRQLENVLSHVHECTESSTDDDKSRNLSCAVCGNKSGAAHSAQQCLSILKKSLALHCDPCLVCGKKAVNLRQCEKHTNISRDQQNLGKCLAVITNAFDRDNQDSIEELIVASKQNSKQTNKQMSYNYYY